jgi:L,D-peptidoglycan transpeptidase YkuD (ErfK/YbiS/YcfS/YnhG family)
MNRKYWWWAGSASVLLLMFGIGIWIRHLPEPPVKELDEARKALAEAEKSHSGIYSAKLFNEAHEAYDSAMRYWTSENSKYFFQRRFYHIQQLARTATQKAKLARERSLSDKAAFKIRLGKRIEEIDKLVKLFGEDFKSLPLPQPMKKKEVKAMLLFAEGKLNYEKHDYFNSAPKIDKSAAELEEVFAIYRTMMQDYFKQHHEWKQLVDETIKESKRKSSNVIIVDKFAAKCYLYSSGKLAYTWDAELGKNWIGDKLKKGDKATPEGVYRVTIKKSGRNTTYYKALAINYPNDEDRKRYAKNKKRGVIPQSSEIGGNIEIHGGGGKGVHWTDGCVALTNKEMDRIFEQVSVGTPVVIVGSIKPFEEVFSFR